MTIILCIVILALLVARRRTTRPQRVRYGGEGNQVVSGRAAFKCGCILAVEGVALCAAHRVLQEVQ